MSSHQSNINLLDSGDTMSEICQNFSKHGNCFNGNMCAYVHVAVSDKTRVLTPCENFKKFGICKNKFSCAYTHN